MRDSYHEQLDDILADLVQMCQKVAIAVRSSTTALLEADIHQAEQVIGDDAELDRMQADIEERAFNLLARQSPVAGSGSRCRPPSSCPPGSIRRRSHRPGWSCPRVPALRRCRAVAGA